MCVCAGIRVLTGQETDPQCSLQDIRVFVSVAVAHTGVNTPADTQVLVLVQEHCSDSVAGVTW